MLYKAVCFLKIKDKVKKKINKKHLKSVILIYQGIFKTVTKIERLYFHLPLTEIIIPDDKTIQFKDALIFGLVGVLRLRNEINVLSSVTGAKNVHSSGNIFK